jgi:hypothetical protein
MHWEQGTEGASRGQREVDLASGEGFPAFMPIQLQEDCELVCC